MTAAFRAGDAAPPSGSAQVTVAPPRVLLATPPLARRLAADNRTRRCTDPASAAWTWKSTSPVHPPPLQRALDRGGLEGAGLSLAIATLYFPAARPPKGPCPSHGAACGLLPWCASAHRLKAVLPRAWRTSLVLVDAENATDQIFADASRVGSQDAHRARRARRPPRPTCRQRERPAAPVVACAQLRVLEPSAALVEAVAAHLHMRLRECTPPRSGGCVNSSWVRAAQYRKVLTTHGPSLFKWHLMASTEYDAVLFTDTDVDLLPSRFDQVAAHAALRADWSRRLPALMRSPRGVRLIASADWSSPINAGVLLLLPSKRVYRDGVSVLQRASFDNVKGWGHAGSPAELLGAQWLLHSDDTTVMHAGAPAVIDHAAWDFVGADIDQGFLTYMFMVAERNATRYARPCARGWSADHFFGKWKPWQLVLQRLTRTAERDAPDRNMCLLARWVQQNVPATEQSEADGQLCHAAFSAVLRKLRDELTRVRQLDWPQCKLARCPSVTKEVHPQRDLGWAVTRTCVL